MPRITVQMFTGRTIDQKRALVKGITDVVVETCNVSPQSVAIVIDEMQDENYARAGTLKCDQ